jgi:hypothetical protein
LVRPQPGEHQNEGQAGDIVLNVDTGNPAVNTGAGWMEFSDRATADAASAQIAAWAP